MSGHRYFTAGQTIGGGWVVFAQDAPTQRADGGLQAQRHVPWLHISSFVQDQRGMAHAVADVLNAQAGQFFDSAKVAAEQAGPIGTLGRQLMQDLQAAGRGPDVGGASC